MHRALSNPGDGTFDGAAAHRQSALLVIGLGAAAAGFPALIALVAYLLRLRKTSVSYLAVAVVIGVLVAPQLARSGQDASPAPTPSSPSVGCQERSGGDTDCPGG